MTKININKNDIKEMVEDSIKNILKEYNNYNLKNEIKYCKSTYNKVYEFLDYMDGAHFNDYMDMEEKDPALFNLMSCTWELYHAFNAFFKSRNIYC